MTKDTEEALRRLEQELLAEEPEEKTEELDYGEFLEEPNEEETVVFLNASNNYGADLRNYATGYKAYNADRLDTNLEEFSEEVRQEKKSTGLWVSLVAVMLTMAVVGYMLYICLGGLL